MSFYKSGFRRVLGAVNTTRAKVDENKKEDTTLAAAVALNTAKTGISGAQASAITSNTTLTTTLNNARVKTFEKVATNATWNALDNITGTGYIFAEEGAPDLRTDTILSIRMETYNPEGVGKTPTAISNVAWYFNPQNGFGESIVDNLMYNIPFYGGQIANSAGVHVCMANDSKSYPKTSNTECNLPIDGSTAVRLSVKLSGALATEGNTNKIRMVITYTTQGSAFNYS